MSIDRRKKEKLLGWLQTAIELELATIPPYLTALLSISPTTNRGAAEAIRSVLMEEMLHMALVANVASSIGGGVRLDRRSLPSYPLTLNFKGQVFKDRSFAVDLAPLSQAAVEVFMRIEEPSERKLQGFRRKSLELDVPGLTIGEFYNNMITLLEELDAAASGDLFTGDPSHQIGVDYYWSAGGQPVVVSDLASAKAALGIVIHQGEGASSSLNDGDSTRFGQPFEVAHYFRFREILVGRRYLLSDDPSAPPSGAPLPVDYDAVYPILVNAKSSDYAPGSALAQLNDAFNSHYTRMLMQLEEALNGQPKVLYTAIMNSMHSLGPIARQLMATPIDGHAQGRHGCPTFEWFEL